MDLYVVMFNNTKKPDNGDEVIGYYPTEDQAREYCELNNRNNIQGVYYFEPCPLLQPV